MEEESRATGGETKTRVIVGPWQHTGPVISYYVLNICFIRYYDLYIYIYIYIYIYMVRVILYTYYISSYNVI